MNLNIFRWYGPEGDVEDTSVIVATVADAQEAWVYLRSRGLQSDDATRAVRFMDGHPYGPLVGTDLFNFRVADVDWIDEEFKVYECGRVL